MKIGASRKFEPTSTQSEMKLRKQPAIQEASQAVLGNAHMCGDSCHGVFSDRCDRLSQIHRRVPEEFLVLPQGATLPGLFFE